ncbi:MAG: MFS transporter, partial [Chitinophagaceae bacterium]
ISAVGCMVGGWLCDRMNRRSAYLLFGLLAAACAVWMAYAPKTELMFILGTSIYAFTTGLCYAGFTAFTLEAIGKGAAATKYNIFAALSNAPIYFMTYIVGDAYAKHGAKRMLDIEAVYAVGAILVFLIIQRILFKKKSKVDLERVVG